VPDATVQLPESVTGLPQLCCEPGAFAALPAKQAVPAVSSTSSSPLANVSVMVAVTAKQERLSCSNDSGT
jgi:hypothetical protein